MDVFYEHSYRVDSRDMDLFGHCRPSAVLGLLQEAATQAAGELGLSGPQVRDRYNAFWMLARIRYELKRPLRWDELVTIKTWHRGGKAAVMYREFDISVGEEPVGQAVSAWVLAGLDSHKILHLDGVGEIGDTSGGSLCRGEVLRKLRLPQELGMAGERRLGYSDTDINGHVNNTRYADFLCDALELETLAKGRFVSRLQLCYLAECMAGETIRLLTGQDEEGFCVRGEGLDGSDRFDGILTLDKLSRGD
ncbi:MAG: acyl-ACP thioesterase [Oscillospiraceae bacterium]|nr:acyl-ACP thioesterase [Oscillospiraceae bacterium]